jgi:predicted DNA-binding transcriptional regulator YafY
MLSPTLGQKSNTETLVAIVHAFLEQRTWRQADLARAIDIGVPALKKRLHELEANGFPFERDAESPADVYWSLPKGWFPGGVTLSSKDVPDLLRLLCRLRRSKRRDELIDHLLKAAPQQAEKVLAVSPAVVAPSASESEEIYLPVVEDAVAQRAALHLHYFTASRGSVEWRHASVQRIDIGAPTRLLVVCHRDGKLKWFRLDNVLAARLAPAEPFRAADPAEVQSMLAESMDGYHQGAPVRCSFVVLGAESRWVKNNLLPGMVADPIPEGIRVTATTAGLLRLARFVVGLGASARVETPELRAMVRELAKGALESPIPPAPSSG